MKKKYIVAFIIFICISTLIFLGIHKYFKMKDSLKHFGIFYAQEDLAILKDNIYPIQKTILSENYKVSLKGIWAQEKCTYFIFKIDPINGSRINKKNIKYNIENKDKINDENGNLTLGGQEYKEDSEGNGILKIKQLSEYDCEEFDIKIEIEKEEFLFKIPKFQKKEMEHFIPYDDSNGDYLYRDIYLSPMSAFIITNDKNVGMPDVELYVSYTDGTNKKMEISEGFVNMNDEIGNVKICMRFLDEVYDTKKIDVISVGNLKYKNIER